MPSLLRQIYNYFSMEKLFIFVLNDGLHRDNGNSSSP